MNKLILPLVLIPVLLVTLFALWDWDSQTNRGYSHGYWGEYNRVRSALVSIPEIRIETTFINTDISLEEFGFTVHRKNLPSVELAFGEQDILRSATGKALLDGLSLRIAHAEQSGGGNSAALHASP